jgi:DNA polymerase-1
MTTLVGDIETDGLDPSVIWCFVTKCIETEEVLLWTKPEGLQAYLDKHGSIVFHNGIGFDVPVLERLWNISFSGIQVKDTLVMSRLADPQRDGHSLAYWGELLGYPKGDYEDWTQYTPEMVEYCKQDVRVTEQVYQRLLCELDSFGNESILLEHQVQTIIQEQVRNGWLLDHDKARDLVAGLKEESYTLEEEVQRVFIPLPTFVKEVRPKIKKDGSMSIVGLKFLGDQWTQVAGPFSRIDWPIFNLGSRQQIGRYLKHFGWRPKTFTETGHAIVSEEILKAVKGIPEASLIASYLLVGKRIAQVSSWLSAADPETQRVHGYVNTNGAVTGRMTHSKPNLAQVPSSNSLYGPECRSCWIVDEGYKLVGIDASGLELRMLAHYMNDLDYTNTILTGDIHTANQLAAGLKTRSQAKVFIYAYLYGAGDEKIGSIVGGGRKQGKLLKEQFLEATPALKTLKENVAQSAAKGYITGLDGRKVFIRSEHAALNSLLQSAGALVMKQALVILDDYATRWGLDYKFVGNVHDEFQVEVLEAHAERFGRLATDCIVAAGTHFKMRCPLAGEYNVGASWAETH